MTILISIALLGVMVMNVCVIVSILVHDWSADLPDAPQGEIRPPSN
jgi:hypothetical protein